MARLLRTPPPRSEEQQKLQQIALEVQRRGERTTQSIAQTKAAVDASKARLVASQAETKSETTRGVVATQAVRTAEVSTASRVVSAQHSTASAIIGAIFAARPVVNVTNVTKSTTIQQRYGPGNGSYGTSSGE